LSAGAAMISKLADQITYTKGSYFADFGSARLGYRDTIPDQVDATIGTSGY
jgi:hypothetical protein